jgi:hypothetical protein
MTALMQAALSLAGPRLDPLHKCPFYATTIPRCWQSARRIGGFFEGTFAPRVLRGLYADELGRLDRYARERRPASGYPA